VSSPRAIYRERTLKSAATFLSRWVDADALMWELTVSIKRLRIVLTEQDRSGNLVIACLDPAWISGPVRWPRARIEVTDDGRPDGEFLVRDPAAGLDVRCGAVEVAEHVKLW
jgi:hypothetical protein